jgi:hypothetical protein
MIEVSGEITEQDYLHAQSFHVKARPLLRLGVTLVLFGCVALIALLVLYGGSRGTTTTVLACVVPLAVLGALVLLGRFSRRRTYRKQRSLQGTHRFVLSDAGLAAESPHGSGEIRWSAFVRWEESPEIFLLYEADNLFHMLPKRWLGGDEARLEELRGLLRDHVG